MKKGEEGEMSEKGKSKYPEFKDREWLNEKYWEDDLSHVGIAHIVGCTQKIAKRALKRGRIRKRTRAEEKRRKQRMEMRIRLALCFEGSLLPKGPTDEDIDIFRAKMYEYQNW